MTAMTQILTRAIHHQRRRNALMDEYEMTMTKMAKREIEERLARLDNWVGEWSKDGAPERDAHQMISEALKWLEHL